MKRNPFQRRAAWIAHAVFHDLDGFFAGDLALLRKIAARFIWHSAALDLKEWEQPYSREDAIELFKVENGIKE